MSEKQAEYKAGPARPTSVERLCDALELYYTPAIYSTPALFDMAADKIAKLEAERDEARAWARKLYHNQQYWIKALKFGEWDYEICPDCQGDGLLDMRISVDPKNDTVTKIACPLCKGSGRVHHA